MGLFVCFNAETQDLDSLFIDKAAKPKVTGSQASGLLLRLLPLLQPESADMFKEDIIQASRVNINMTSQCK